LCLLPYIRVVDDGVVVVVLGGGGAQWCLVVGCRGSFVYLGSFGGVGSKKEGARSKSLKCYTCV